MTKNEEKILREHLEKKMKTQFINGMRQGAYGIAGAIDNMINEFKGDDYEELIRKIKEFLAIALRKNK